MRRIERIKRRYILFRENIVLAFAAVRASRVRSVLTMLIIALGIMSLMGMITVMHAVVISMENSLGSQQGAMLVVRSWSPSLNVNNTTRLRGRRYESISYRDAQRFGKLFTPHGLSAYAAHGRSVQARRGTKSTRPYMTVLGISSDYCVVENIPIVQGRAFTTTECALGQRVLLLGESVKKKLFDEHESPLGKKVSLGSVQFTVVGIIGTRAGEFGSSTGDALYIPLQAMRACYSYPDARCEVFLQPREGMSIPQAKIVAEQLMRKVRRLHLLDENNFDVSLRDEFLNAIKKSLSSIAAGIILIGLVTLVGSAIGLMNIMLASVTERTQEIGTRKALGAYASTIRQQFLIESIFITLIGGILGILLGLFVGGLIANLMHIDFVMPWGWVLGSVVLCVGVGVLAGYMPAKRAAKLDPIVSLRYE